MYGASGFLGAEMGRDVVPVGTGRRLGAGNPEATPPPRVTRPSGQILQARARARAVFAVDYASSHDLPRCPNASACQLTARMTLFSRRVNSLIDSHRLTLTDS